MRSAAFQEANALTNQVLAEVKQIQNSVLQEIAEHNQQAPYISETSP